MTPERKRTTEDQFFFFLENQMTAMMEQLGAMNQVKEQIERALQHNFIVEFFLDEETNEIGFEIRPKKKAGLVP